MLHILFDVRAPDLHGLRVDPDALAPRHLVYASHDHREECRNTPLHSEPDRSQCFQLVVSWIARENPLHQYVVRYCVQHRYVIVISRGTESIEEASEKTRMGDGSEQLTDVQGGGTGSGSIRMR